MRTARNAAVFLGVLVLVIIGYPIALAEVGSALVDGRNFENYFGWFSWPHVIFAGVAFIVFVIGGALLSRLIASRHAFGWTLLLGLVYGTIRMYFSSASVASAREPEEIAWLLQELIVPVLASCLGAYIYRRYTRQRVNGAKAA